MAKEFRSLPSDLLKIGDPYIAYCLNEACYMWGTYVDNEVNEVGEKPDRKMKDIMRKRQHRLTQLVTSPEDLTAQSTKKFRDPAEVMGRK